MIRPKIRAIVAPTVGQGIWTLEQLIEEGQIADRFRVAIAYDADTVRRMMAMVLDPQELFIVAPERCSRYVIDMAMSRIRIPAPTLP